VGCGSWLAGLVSGRVPGAMACVEGGCKLPGAGCALLRLRPPPPPPSSHTGRTERSHRRVLRQSATSCKGAGAAVPGRSASAFSRPWRRRSRIASAPSVTKGRDAEQPARDARGVVRSRHAQRGDLEHAQGDQPVRSRLERPRPPVERRPPTREPYQGTTAIPESPDAMTRSSGRPAGGLSDAIATPVPHGERPRSVVAASTAGVLPAVLVHVPTFADSPPRR